jgi:hypothetical protein
MNVPVEIMTDQRITGGNLQRTVEFKKARVPQLVIRRNGASVHRRKKKMATVTGINLGIDDVSWSAHKRSHHLVEQLRVIHLLAVMVVTMVQTATADVYRREVDTRPANGTDGGRVDVRQIPVLRYQRVGLVKETRKMDG